MDSKKFEVTLGKEWEIARWWDRNYPRQPFWQLPSDSRMMVDKKYNKNVLKDVRRLLQKSVEKAIITDVRLIANTTFAFTAMGPQDVLDTIDPSKIG